MILIPPTLSHPTTCEHFTIASECWQGDGRGGYLDSVWGDLCQKTLMVFKCLLLLLFITKHCFGTYKWKEVNHPVDSRNSGWGLLILLSLLIEHYYLCGEPVDRVSFFVVNYIDVHVKGTCIPIQSATRLKNRSTVWCINYKFLRLL